MIDVYLSSPYNSTMFTKCCRVAINDDQGRCPACREEVSPGEAVSTAERSRSRWDYAYGAQVRERIRP